MGEVRTPVVLGALISAGLASASLFAGASAPWTCGALAVAAVMITTRRSASPRD